MFFGDGCNTRNFNEYIIDKPNNPHISWWITCALKYAQAYYIETRNTRIYTDYGTVLPYTYIPGGGDIWMFYYLLGTCYLPTTYVQPVGIN